MVGGIAEELVQDAVALHVEAYVIFVGHPDAAVHLDAFLNGESRRATGLGLGDADHRFGVVAALVEQLLRLDRGRAGDLELGVEMRGPMLKYLELADQFPELLPLLE